MNILLLGQKSYLLKDILLKNFHTITIKEDKIIDVEGYDFIISFGYRYIIKEDIVNKFKNKIINLHISYLPYNKGADPNLWSFLEDSPKGVSIHQITKDLDCGDILLRKEVFFDDFDTLKTSYDKLINEIVSLFNDNSENILNGKIIPFKQKERGSYHTTKDKLKYKYLYKDLGYDTLVKDIKGKAL